MPSARITQGDLEVDAEPLDPTLVSSAAAGLRPVGLEGPRPPRPPIPGTGVVPDPLPGSLPEVEPAASLEVEASAGQAWMPLEATPPPADELAVGTQTPAPAHSTRPADGAATRPPTVETVPDRATQATDRGPGA